MHIYDRDPPSPSRASQRAGLSVGMCAKLKQAIRCKFGTPLPACSPRSIIPCGGTEARRVFALPHARSLVVLLSPGLPCRSGPTLASPIASWRRVGEVVVAVAVCDGWFELLRGGAEQSGRTAWALHDGTRVGHAGIYIYICVCVYLSVYVYGGDGMFLLFRVPGSLRVGLMNDDFKFIPTTHLTSPLPLQPTRSDSHRHEDNTRMKRRVRPVDGLPQPVWPKIGLLKLAPERRWTSGPVLTVNPPHSYVLVHRW